MKILLLIISSLLFAETHNFREVHYKDKTLKNVQLAVDNSKYTFSIWYQGKPLKQNTYIIISCKSKEHFCLTKGSYEWLKLK